MGRGGIWKRRAAAAAGGSRPGSPEARLQAAFVRIAQADDRYREQVGEVFRKDACEMMQAAFAEEAKATAFERRRLAAFDRVAAGGDPADEEEYARRTKPQGSGWFVLLLEFAELLDEYRPLSGAEAGCLVELAALLHEMANAPERPPALVPAPVPELAPELAGALSRLEEIATAFAVVDAQQAAALTDPALTAADKAARLEILGQRQHDYVDRLYMEADE